MIKFNEEKCTGCATCANVCPQGVIMMKNKKAQMADYASCMECGACRLNCEFDAIDITTGTGCLFTIIDEEIQKIKKKYHSAATA